MAAAVSFYPDLFFFFSRCLFCHKICVNISDLIGEAEVGLQNEGLLHLTMVFVS